jgi:hypothetical protein
VIEDRFERALAEPAAVDESFVVRSRRWRRTDQRAVVGEDADDVAATADLAAGPHERVG